MTVIKTHTWDIAYCLHQQPDQLVSGLKTVRFLHASSNEARLVRFEFVMNHTLNSEYYDICRSSVLNID